MRGFLVKDKAFYREFFWLTAMMALQNLLSYSVNLADNMMLGQYDETSLAASSIVNQIQYLLQMTSVNGLGSGGVILIAQYWGKGDHESVRRVIALTMKFALGTGVLFCAICVAAPEAVVGLLTTDQAVAAEAARYLRVIGVTYLVFPLQASLVLCLRGVGVTRLGPVVSLVSLALNIIGNWLLIYGNCGAPELGIEGAAWASLAARVVEVSVVLVFAVRNSTLPLKLSSFLAPDACFLKDFLRVSLPVVGEGVTFGVANIFQIAILGRLTQPVIAANSIAVTMHQIVTVFGFGTANSSSVMIGRAIGSGRMDVLKSYARTMQLLYVGIGLATCAVLFLSIDFVLGFYAIGDETRMLAAEMMRILCFTVVCSCYQYPCMCGIIAGGGNTMFAFVMDVVFTLGVAIIGAALSAFMFGWPPLVTFALLKSDQVLKCIPNAIVVNRFRWARDLTRG
ncbi:MAG: MATE family efflux transporter [Eggerthellaceae bacterium]|nr:MATE family efflux transporter [Eggerthellaceae bacterium]